MKTRKKSNFMMKYVLSMMLALTLVVWYAPLNVWAVDNVTWGTNTSTDSSTQTYSGVMASVDTSGNPISIVYSYTAVKAADGSITVTITKDGVPVDANTVNVPTGAWTARSANASTSTQDKIGEITDLMKPTADLSAAQQTLTPVMSIVNVIIGILATVILIAIGLFTAIDVLYLEVPALHSSMDETAMAKGQQNKSGGVKPRLVSEDASQAYDEATNGDNPKNPIIIYLKKRIVAYIAVAIVLYMLLSGNMALLVNIVLKLLSGVFEWFQSFAA